MPEERTVRLRSGGHVTAYHVLDECSHVDEDMPELPVTQSRLMHKTACGECCARLIMDRGDAESFAAAHEYPETAGRQPARTDGGESA